MTTRPLAFAVVAAILALAPAARAADASLSLAPTLPLLDAAPANPEDSAVRLTLYWENDGGFAKPWNRHDRHYTAGAGASLAWRAPWVNRLLRPVPSFFGEFDRPDTAFAMGFVGALTIYTPEDIARPDPILNDRPYAGWTYGGLFFQRSHLQPENVRYADAYTHHLAEALRPEAYAASESLEVDIGILGPSSLAQNAQEMIHHAYDYVYPEGWNNQIHDEPEFSIKYNRKWRSPVFMLTEAGHMLDILPDVGLTAGSLVDEIHAGIMFRVGYNIPADFGPGELARPADFTSSPSFFDDAPPRDRIFDQSLYLFARPYGRLVAHNALLQGDNFRHDDPVTQTPEPAVFGVQYGFVHRIYKYFEFDYVVTTESPEFHGQHGWDTWASVQFSFSYAW
jgi:hypothetical protein